MNIFNCIRNIRAEPSKAAHQTDRIPDSVKVRIELLYCVIELIMTIFNFKHDEKISLGETDTKASITTSYVFKKI
jgi:hypothetical protein